MWEQGNLLLLILPFETTTDDKYVKEEIYHQPKTRSQIAKAVHRKTKRAVKTCHKELRMMS